MSFHINGFHGDTYKDLAVIKQFTVLEEAAEVKEIATHPLSLQIAHPTGSFLSIAPGLPPKICSRSCHFRLEGSALFLCASASSSKHFQVIPASVSRPQSFLLKGHSGLGTFHHHTL